MDPALDPPATRRIGSERELLDAWLEFHRQTLRWKCSNLTPEQLCMASAPPSRMSLLGLVRHMTDVEHWWFVQVGAVGPELERYPREDEDLCEADPATADADFAAYDAAVEAAREAFAAAELDTVVRHPMRDQEISVRWIALHMIEEYARHNGHADLLRERIDGATGS
jgi:hypothetical protein